MNKKRIDAIHNFKNYNFLCTRTDNAVSAAIKNKADIQMNFKISKATTNNYENTDRIFFENDGIVQIEPRVKSSLYDQDMYVHETQSVYFRVKSGTNEVFLDNTVCDQLPSKTSIPDSPGTVVGISVMNTETSHIITVRNLPQGALGYNLIRRSITDNEKEYKIIKNLQTKPAQPDTSYLDMEENNPIFTKDMEAITFIDDNVIEDNDYEYKLLYYKDNCEKTKSISSSVDTYEKRRNILNVTLIDSESLEDKTKDGSVDIEEDNFINFSFRVTKNESEIDKIFSSLDRNTFDLFAPEFEQIKESIRKYTSSVVYLQNLTNSEKTFIGRFMPDSETDIFTVSVEIKNIFDEYAVVVEPRYSTPTSIINNIIEKIELLPIGDRNMPVSAAINNLRSISSARKSTQLPDNDYVSGVGIKYNSRSVRFLGTIIDPKSRYNKERNDFFYDGKTGDKRAFVVNSKKYNEYTTRLSLVNYDDITSIVGDDTGLKNEKGLVLNLKASNAFYVDFYAIYTKSNGTINYQGLINPEPDQEIGNYNFYLDLDGEVGCVEIYSVTIEKDGTLAGPYKLGSALCNKDNVRLI